MKGQKAGLKIVILVSCRITVEAQRLLGLCVDVSRGGATCHKGKGGGIDPS